MNNFSMSPEAIVIASVVGVVALGILLLVIYLAVSRIAKAMKWCVRILLVLVLIAVFAAGAYLLGGQALRAQLEHHYGRIRTEIPISEVRRSLDGVFDESDVSLEQIVKEGHSLDRITSLKGKKLYAKKYAYHMWEKLYIYVIYDDKGTVVLKLPARQ